jgi:YgiT-type zinc finger domain-containing protein
MICLICRQAEVVNGLTTVRFERGELRLIVSHVPARVCPGCGEAYVAAEVAVRLLREAEAMFAAGEMDGDIQYQPG